LDYVACIQKSIDYIEENLKLEVALNDCAREAGFSVYHYYQVFGAYVGLPVMEYVRKRRLAWALTELKQGLRIIDVALDFGFGSERAFSRAFKKQYGLSPGKYRVLIDSSSPPAKLVLKSFHQNNIYGGVVMEPKFVKKEAFKVAGYEIKTTNVGRVNYQVLPEFWSRYFSQNWGKVLHEKIKPISHAELGICFPGGLEEGEFSYVIGVEVADFSGVPEGLFKGEVPAATYAVFTSPPAEREGNQLPKSVQGTWDYIYASWFPGSGYEFDDKSRVDFELYNEPSLGDHGIQADIYVPVVKKR
jgi:AraC family transcriptional regulator